MTGTPPETSPQRIAFAKSFGMRSVPSPRTLARGRATAAALAATSSRSIRSAWSTGCEAMTSKSWPSRTVDAVLDTGVLVFDTPMSIYATLWQLKFPRDGNDHTDCEWIEVIAQGVPAHIGTSPSGHVNEENDPYANF